MRSAKPVRVWAYLGLRISLLQETALEGALRECHEESLAQLEEASLYALYDIPEINQIYVFYRANMPAADFGPTPESSEVALFSEDNIPWDELAFPVIELALHHFLGDRREGNFQIRNQVIRRPWRSPRSL